MEHAKKCQALALTSFLSKILLKILYSFTIEKKLEPDLYY